MVAQAYQIYGVVQGVFFRKTTAEVARRLGLVGWVKNAADGSVHAYAAGTQDQLDQFIAFLQVGPPNAVVQKVTVESVSVQEFKSFTVL